MDMTRSEAALNQFLATSKVTHYPKAKTTRYNHCKIERERERERESKCVAVAQEISMENHQEAAAGFGR
jgi:hypothetical protein